MCGKRVKWLGDGGLWRVLGLWNTLVGRGSRRGRRLKVSVDVGKSRSKRRQECEIEILLHCSSLKVKIRDAEIEFDCEMKVGWTTVNSVENKIYG